MIPFLSLCQWSDSPVLLDTWAPVLVHGAACKIHEAPRPLLGGVSEKCREFHERETKERQNILAVEYLNVHDWFCYFYML